MQATPLPLKDLHMPEAIGWWPPALGWWLLAVVILSAIIFLIWLYKQLTRKTAIKAAKKILQEIKSDQTADTGKKLSELSILFRRVAISISPKKKAAGLTGNSWLTFLDASVPGTPFSEGIGRYLADAPYRKSPPDDLEISQLISLCEDWLNAQSKQRR
jgi:hypothetical protein